MGVRPGPGGMEQQIGKLFEEFDFILGPVSRFLRFLWEKKVRIHLAMYLADLCSVLPNLTRCPAISIPGNRPRPDCLWASS